MTTNAKSKKAIVYVTGMQFGQDISNTEDKIQTITPGTYKRIGEYYYVKYEELQEGFTEKSDVLLKVKSDLLEITKKGLINVHMMIATKETHQTNYATPFGNLVFTIHGKTVTVTETKEGLNIYAKYSMDVNYEHLSVNELRVEVKEQE